MPLASFDEASRGQAGILCDARERLNGSRTVVVCFWPMN